MLIVKKLHTHFRDRIVEWGLSYILISWGLVLLATPGAFLNHTVLAYAGWASLARQETWGFASLIVGLLRLAALYINGAHSKTPLVRTIAAFASMFIWFWVTVGIFRLPYATTGIAVYPWLMAADAYSVYNAAGDAYTARFHKKGGGLQGNAKRG
jgi:cytochrome bd-type quinol oxidase subunit 2